MKSIVSITTLIGALSLMAFGFSSCATKYPYYGAPVNNDFVPDEVRAQP